MLLDVRLACTRERVVKNLEHFVYSSSANLG